MKIGRGRENYLSVQNPSLFSFCLILFFVVVIFFRYILFVCLFWLHFFLKLFSPAQSAICVLSSLSKHMERIVTFPVDVVKADCYTILCRHSPG